ncbi:MAG: RDD family protein, partial [Aequorivita vladivostokensis]|nr:RDD family protein [Aequorivita vladivostokensis]
MNVKNKRILALLLDLAIIGFISSLVTSMIKFEWELGTYSLFNHRISFGLSLSVLFYLVYFILCDIFWNSMTIGKEVLKIKVISQDGAPLELKSRIYRTLLKTISIIFWPI